MTFEEFKKLALNTPFTNEPAVYRVDVFRVVDPNGNKLTFALAVDDDINQISESDLKQNDGLEEIVYYPKYKVNKSGSYIFPTFDDATRFIQSDEVTSDNNSQIFCIRIYELPFGKNVISECCKREWIYDGNGNLIEQSVCSSLIEDLDKPEGNFRGRSKESIRFKPGDIVEVHDMDNMEVRLAIVLALCNDIESCWMEYQKVIDGCKKEGLSEEDADNNYWLNACDDCYHVGYDSEPEYGTSFPYTTNVFTPRFPIPDNLKKRLYVCYNNTLPNPSIKT